MTMRILNETGRSRYREEVIKLKAGLSSSPPYELLEDADTSTQIMVDVVLPEFNECTKFEFAESLIPVIEVLESSEIDGECWPGIWDGLALHYFDLISPKTKSGKLKLNDPEHYCFTDNYKVVHRHRIYGPTTLARKGGKWVKAFLHKTPDVLGEFEEQVGSRQEMAGNQEILKVLNHLYIQENGASPKKGYTTTRKIGKRTKKIPGPGTLRRFYALHTQLSRTYDLFGIDASQILSLLPPEFDRWKEN